MSAPNRCIRTWVLLGGLFAWLMAAAALRGQESVCARVKIEILQELTLEREAFEARMTVRNGVAGTSIDNLAVEVNFTDETLTPVLASSDPNHPSALFFIRFQDGSGLPASVAGGASAVIQWLIIPTRGAAGTSAQGKLYYVGATLRYWATGIENSVTVEPDDITVKPMPALTLDYFLPEEVYGDDPFTESFTEPPIAFSLGVRVKNSGLGVARKLKIDSAQPRIVENKQGLLVDFKLHGCEVNGYPAQPTLLADFGDIPSGRSGVARWIMTSSLSGRFVDFTAYYTHADELGGQLTSLMTGQAQTHLLIRDVVVDLPGRDAVRDFLARDGAELRVFESENADISVSDQSSVSTVLTDAGRHRVRTAPFAGFLFIRLPDPLAGRQVLQSVQRLDGKVLVGSNGWLSQTWDRNAKKWDYFVNVFDADNRSGADYLLQFKGGSARTNRPPQLDPLSNWVIGPQDHLTFPITANDPDGDRLTFQIEGAARPGISTTPEGRFQWLPGSAPAPSTNRLTVLVTDHGLEALSDRRAFTVVVRDSRSSVSPVLRLSQPRRTYAELTGTMRLDPESVVTDGDTPVFDQGRLSVGILEGGTEADRLGLAEPQGSSTNLAVTESNVVHYRGVPIGTLTVTTGETNSLDVDFNARATVAIVQDVVREVTFSNGARRGGSPERVIQFSLTDGKGGVSAPVDLELVVEPANQAPVARDDEAATSADMPIALAISKLIGNDVEPDGDSMRFELLGEVTQQRGVVYTVGQVVAYVPDPSLVGMDTFDYRITDDFGAWSEGRVQITVRAPSTTARTIVAVTPGEDGSVGVRFLGIPNRVYTVEWSFDLLYWSVLGKATAGATGFVDFTDRTADPSRRFYRIIFP